MGKLIVIEGLDASGKRTQAEILLKRLQESGKEAFEISLPNYADESSALVRMYLRGDLGDKPSDVNAYAASTFYAVDRYASFKKSWGKEYNSGKIIVANRYTTSNACHQMTKLDESEWDAYLSWLFDFEYRMLEIPKPDCVIYLDMPVEISQRLLLKRYHDDESKKDVHEKDVAYLKSCHKAADYACEKLGWNRIACSLNGEPRAIEAIADDIFSVLERKSFFDD